jgi:hypothetical protein
MSASACRDCPPAPVPFVVGTKASSTKEDDMKYALLIYDRPGTYDRLPDGEHEAVFGSTSPSARSRTSSAARSSSRSRPRRRSA